MGALLGALNGVLNAREPVPGLATGGQPTAEHMRALKQAGAAAVIDMRDPMEPQPIDPRTAVEQAGLSYINIPVSHSVPEDATLDLVRSTLKRLRTDGKPVFAYCNSGNRVGAVLIPYFMLDLGLSEDEAVNHAMAIGTRSAELIEGALDYAKRKANVE